ncbi:MAG: DNA-processing protein DprA [Treponema sp.]|jgi:DNA processing protein|nr:DNA-processing protein DprA [Treponema sp.]
MAERGLLDLMIARLGLLSVREKLLLCESLEDEQDLIQKSQKDIEALIGHEMPAFWNINNVHAQAGRDEKTARLKGINWVSWRGAAYPPLLREIYDPPALLFYRGSLPNPESPLAAIVGTRRPSPQAAAQAFDIAKGLAGGSISVVSGLALGIDAMAHRGNIEGGAPTAAVLGSALDQVYPLANRNLARRILETGGVLLSEYPPGTGPRKWNFPARNRIISGLARGVLIVEAPQKSGALITARFALDQNRDLWVASAGTAENQSIRLVFDRRGTKKLAEEGAGIIRRASDILKAWNMEAANGITGNAAVSGGAFLASSLADSLGIAL